MSPGLLALLSGLLLATGEPGEAPRGREIDRVVAVIRNGSMEPRVVTQSRVEEETRIAIIARGGGLAATEALDEATLAAGLQALIDETLLGDDATRLQVFESETGMEDPLVAFRAQFARPADYQAFLLRWDLSEDDVTAVLRRKARVERYLESRVSHAAQVSEGEITAWLDENAASIGARDRDLARARLTEQRVRDEVKTFVRDLRARADVRLLPKAN